MCKHLLLIFLLLLIACTPQDEMPPPPAVPAIKVDAEADKGLISRAENGDRTAQYLVGESLCCANPLKKADDTDERNEEATGWYCRAATAGLPEAQYRLGEIYSGDLFNIPASEDYEADKTAPGVRQRMALALMWYETAAENRYSRAMGAAIRLRPRLSKEEIVAAADLKKNWKVAPCTWRLVYYSSI